MRASAKNVQSESELQGKQQPEPGTYHVVCKAEGVKEVAVKKDGTDLNCSIVPCEVLTGTVPGQEGKEIVLFLKFDKNGNPAEQHTRFCMAAGLLKPGEERDIDFESEVPGKQLVVAVESYIDKNKKKALSVAEFGMAMWHVNNAEVATIPKNTAALALLGRAGGTAVAAKQQAVSQAKAGANGNGNGNGASPTGGPTATAVAAAADSASPNPDNDFSDV